MRWGRGVLVFAIIVPLLCVPGAALANHCAPPPEPLTWDDVGGPNYCHQTPRPSPRPTPRPTPRPATAPPATPSPVYVPPPVGQTTPTDDAPAQSPIEVSPAPTAEITVPGPAFNTLPSAPIDTVRNSASLTTWIFGFIAGFLIGALVGRASWGVSRRRRSKQIFG